MFVRHRITKFYARSKNSKRPDASAWPEPTKAPGCATILPLTPTLLIEFAEVMHSTLSNHPVKLARLLPLFCELLSNQRGLHVRRLQLTLSAPKIDARIGGV